MSIGAYNLPSHVVAALLQLDHCSAVITPLPACLLCHFEELIGLLILGTIFTSVPLAIAKTTDLCLATAALPILLPIFLVNIGGLDPFTAASSGAIDSILCRILLKFSIPRLLKLDIK